MPKPPRQLSPQAKALLPRLQDWTSGLDDIELTITFGNRTWKSGGKAFLVLDRYIDVDCLWLRIPDYRRPLLLATPGWSESPYDPKKQALCVSIDAIDDARMPALIHASYDLALKR
jgi:predicted DNA-binding protein (MmcQ/YjbR family)